MEATVDCKAPVNASLLCKPQSLRCSSKCLSPSARPNTPVAHVLDLLHAASAAADPSWHAGHVVDEHDMLRDVLLLKAANVNAVRCSHYPNDPSWYELAALHGLYLVDEANVESHGFDPGFAHDAAHPAHHPSWLAALMARVTRMHGRDKNAPAVIMWSLGNEAGYGAAHDAAAAWLRRVDPSRPVHYEVRLWVSHGCLDL
jgi:beta-galactosidase/beta-glucuronidase